MTQKLCDGINIILTIHKTAIFYWQNIKQKMLYKNI